jgi:phosphoribosylanthranilate isomerase
LNVINVGLAIEQVAPFAVDVSSGVESEKGVKDHKKIARFVQAVRKADSEASNDK